MKIVPPQKPGVPSPTHPFKRVMSAVNDTKNKPLPPPLPRPLPASAAHPPGLKAAKPPQPVSNRPTVSPLADVRAQHDAKAKKLVELRGEQHEHAKQRFDTRLVDLICHELKIELSHSAERPAKLAAANSDRAPAASPPQLAPAPVASLALATAKREAEVKAASAAELIEKIEAFVKSSRPVLAITLDSSLGARVEIERLGPREVALRLIGANGPPTPEDVGRIRDEMRARGLKVGALSVA